MISELNSILEAIQPLLIWWWDDVLNPIASWTADLFLDAWDAINEALSSFSDWCKEHQSTIQDIVIAVNAFFAAWAISSLVNGMVGFVASGDLAVKMMSLLEGGASLLGKAIAFITSPVGIATVVLGTLITIGVLVYKNWDTIKEKAIEIWGAISEWFSETIEGIKGFFTGLWEGIQDTFAEVGEWFQGIFEGAMKAIQKAFSTIGSFFTGCWNAVKRVFSSVGSWFYGIFSGAWSKITSAFSSVGSFFSDVWRGIQEAFGSVSSWFHDTFTEAWTAVKNVFCTGGEIFSGIVDGILDGLKGVINAIIRGINDVIAIPFNGLNSALDNLRSIEILSMKPFSWLPSISVPQIPELAQGGYVKANTPQLALIGDNRHQGEVVAPENKLREMAAEASGAGNAEVIRLLKQLIGIVESMDLNVILEFRGQLSALARTLEPYMERERNRKGRKLTTGGVVIG